MFQPAPLCTNVVEARREPPYPSMEMLIEISRLFFLPGFSDDMKGFFLCMIGEINRGHPRGQQLFNDLCDRAMSPYERDLPRFLIGLAFDEKRGIYMRTSALYCLQCCLFLNAKNNKTKVTQALLSVAYAGCTRCNLR